jgi:NADPH:quinone reductase-like Zn-dependent oxidoreductase
VLKPGGALVSAVQPPAPELMAKFGAKGGMVQVQPDAAQLDQFTGWIESGRLKPFVETVLPLTEVRKAHELSQSGRSRGKIVLTVS